MKVRITQLDGKLPNLALMRLSSWHRDRGDDVVFTKSVDRHDDEPDYDAVYGSAIFTMSAEIVDRFRNAWPNAILGGTGSGESTLVEHIIGNHNHHDYSIYPDFAPSIGFASRGCRMKCEFCVVPGKEGKSKSVNGISDIWRGDGHPKKLLLLDNDFFGNPEWRERVKEIRDGGFKVCLNQGINVRIINDEAAEALASIQYRNDAFNARMLYTAWDNIGDERVFFRGVERLEKAGIPPKHLMTYMLIGFDPEETQERILYRFNKMREMGIRPYPMVFDPTRKDLKAFQRWVVTGLYRAVSWKDYRHSKKLDYNKYYVEPGTAMAKAA